MRVQQIKDLGITDRKDLLSILSRNPDHDMSRGQLGQRGMTLNRLEALVKMLPPLRVHTLFGENIKELPRKIYRARAAVRGQIAGLNQDLDGDIDAALGAGGIIASVARDRLGRGDSCRIRS